MRLKPGMIIELDGEPHRVVRVNFSRACCVPVARRTVTFVSRGSTRVAFTREGAVKSISVNSEVTLLK